MHRRIYKAVTMLTLTALLLTGCTSEASNIGRAQEKRGESNVVDTGFTLSTVGSYDSADTAVVLSTDLDNKAVTFVNMDTGKPYTLYYDGTTYVQDKHDGPMTISQIEAGDVVDVTFLKGKKKLASIKLSPEAWVYDDIYNYDLAGSNRTASIGSQTYSLPDGVVVLSEGRRVEAGEVVSQDIVTISGIDHKIYSVNVDRGHGYLRLKNDQALLGGWIEVGNRVIRQITEDMLLVVPEGSYQVVLTNKNVGCVKEVTVERDKEVVLDVSDLEVAEDAVGKILFTVTPEMAKVSVDGKAVDISKAVELRYGIHQVQVEASGYDTLTRHIQVGSEYATISFKLEESRKENNSSVSDNSTSRIPWQDTLDTIETTKPSVSDNTLSTISGNALGTSSSYKVYIDSPKDVEVYLDGNYIGISPVRFTKTSGRHEITLKKSGYKTKTYTIYLENTKKDETYSFSALEKESSGSSNNNSDKDTTTSKSTGEAPLPSGKVKFTVIPDDAKSSITKTTIDDDIADIGKEVELKYGSHTVYIKAEGYKEFSKTFEVNAQESEPILCELEKISESSSDGSTSTPPKPEEPENKLSVIVTSDKTKVMKNETVTFTAVVKDSNDEEKEDAEVEWEISNEVTNSISVEDGKTMTLSVSSEETAKSFTVTATYTGVNEKCSGSVEIEIVESEPVQDAENEKETEGKSEVSKDPVIDQDENIDDENSTSTDDNNENVLMEETVTISQNAHPIRKFFSSLFK